MAIGNYYPVNLTISDNDLFLGTNGNSNNTVNYTAQAVADYLNTNAKISIGGQLSFRFDTVPGIAKTISFNGGGGDNTPFSSITQLIVSSTDASGVDITIFLSYLNGSEILLSQQNQPNNFGHYKITGYTPVAAPYFYALQLQYIGGNGNIMENKYYDIGPFTISSSAPVPTLNQVLTAGNTSLLNTKIGSLYLYDTTEIDYGYLTLNDSEFKFYDTFGSAITMARSSIQFMGVAGGFYGTLLLPAVTANRTYTLPNASGTIALTSNIPSVTPSALTKVDDTNVTLTLGGAPATSLLEAVSLTLGWAGTLADSRITSASTWNAKQDAISLTTIGSGAATFISNVLNIPTPPAATFTSLTTTGSSGSSTLISGVLNVPTYTLAGLGGVPTNRTLTINGVAQDLSSDRTWSVGTVTSVGLSMPSAFTVSSSPITTSGTIAVTGAGVASQYVRGDGTLATFPTSTGGGSSFTYYLNGSISQGTFGGNTYYQMSRTPIFGAGTNFTRTNGAGNGYIASFITNAGDPSQLNIPGGNWNVAFYFNASFGGGSPSFYAELYKVDVTNAFTLIASDSLNPEGITNGTTVDQYFTSIPVPQTTLLITDRLAVRIFVNTGGRTITLHTENSNLSELLTTFSTGLTALNGLTAQVQYFAVGTSGIDFNISSVLDTHTFNLPTASAANRGALSSTDWSAFNGKQNAITLTTTGSSGSSTFVSNTLNVPTYTLSGLGGVPYIGATNDLDLGTNDIYANEYNFYDPSFLSYGRINLSAEEFFFKTTPTDVVARITYGSTFLVGTTYSAQLVYTGLTADRVYTFPNASGTIALTSDIPSLTGYVQTTRTISTTSPLQGGGDLSANRTLSILEANASQNGYLSSTDWSTFNGKQDAITLTTTGTSGPATLVGATLNIPQYSGGGGGSSNPSVINFSAVDGTIITGTLSETVSQSLLIPANTYTGNGLLEIVNTMTKVGIAGTSRFRIYKNTSNTLIGATLISQSAVIAASLLFANMTRIMRVNSNILTGFNTATQAFSDFNSSGAGFSTTFLTSVDNYIIFTITLGSVADNANISMARLIKTI